MSYPTIALPPAFNVAVLSSTIASEIAVFNVFRLMYLYFFTKTGFFQKRLTFDNKNTSPCTTPKRLRILKFIAVSLVTSISSNFANKLSCFTLVGRCGLFAAATFSLTNDFT